MRIALSEKEAKCIIRLLKVQKREISKELNQFDKNKSISLGLNENLLLKQMENKVKNIWKKEKQEVIEILNKIEGELENDQIKSRLYSSKRAKRFRRTCRRKI